MYFYTSDEHYGHGNVIKYNNRPFSCVEDMNAALIKNNNEVVTADDIVVHVGDFTFIKNKKRVHAIIEQLNGQHIFIRGSHDYWLPKSAQMIWEKRIGQLYIVACHYPMYKWARSHYNSWHVFGHTHGTLDMKGKCWDVGVDNNNYYPVSLIELTAIMEQRPDNHDYIKRSE